MASASLPESEEQAYTRKRGGYSWEFQSGSVVAVRPSEVRQVCYETEQRGFEVVERPHAIGEGDTRHRPHLQVERDRRSDALLRRRPRPRQARYHGGIRISANGG